MTVGGDTGDDSATGVAKDAKGNVFACGVFYGEVTFVDALGTWGTLGGANVECSDCEHSWVAKLNSGGAIEWAVVLAESRSTTSEVGPGAKVYELSLDLAGSAYMVGLFYDVARFGEAELRSGGLSDTFLTKVDSNGTIQKTVVVGSGTEKQCGSDVAVLSDGACAVVGQYGSSLTFDGGKEDMMAAGKEGFLVMLPAGIWTSTLWADSKPTEPPTAVLLEGRFLPSPSPAAERRYAGLERILYVIGLGASAAAVVYIAYVLYGRLDKCGGNTIVSIKPEGIRPLTLNNRAGDKMPFAVDISASNITASTEGSFRFSKASVRLGTTR
jgi:hypothetical protein